MKRYLCVCLPVVLFSWGCPGGGGGGDGDATLDGDIAADAMPDGMPDPGDGGPIDGALPDGTPPDLGVIDGPAPNFDGRVMGLVYGVVPDGPRVALIGADVWLETVAGDARSVPVITDDTGRYEIGPAPLGTFRVCARYGALTPVCSAEDVTITADSPYFVRPIDFALMGAIMGRLIQADGTPCGFRSQAHGLVVRGTVSFGELEVQANDRGDFVITALPAPGDHTLRGQCEGAVAEQTVTITPDSLAGPAQRVTLRTANTPPDLGAIAFVGLGRGTARHPMPGDEVRIDVRADDPDDDAVTIRLVDEAGEEVPLIGGEFRVFADDHSSQRLYIAVASDGQGGYRESRGVLRVGDRPARLGGQVLDPAGEPVEGARVFIGRTSAATDATGRFRLSTALADTYILTARAPGYVERQLTVDAESSRLVLRMQPTTAWTVAPLDEHTLQDEAGLAAVHLPLGAVQAGRVRSMTVSIAGFDPARAVDFPGGRAAVNGRDQPVEVDFHAALAVEITTDAGVVPLGRGRTAELIFPARPVPDGEAPPETLDLFFFDRAANVWRQEGEAQLVDGAYVAEVSHFSEWSVGLAFGEAEACMRVDVPLEMLGQFRLRIKQASSSVGGGTVLGEWIPSQTINVVRHLRHNSRYTVQVVSLTDPPQVIDWYSSSTDGPPFNRFIGFPYTQGHEGCYYPVRIKPFLPGFGFFLNRFYGDFDSSWQYYNLIGYDENTTLASWKAAWGFTAEDEANTVGFYNPQEFGLGRRGTCHTRGSTVEDLEMACCVAKYGHVGGDRIEALHDTISDTHVGDTVCMEYSAGPGPDRIVKFLAFKSTGELSASTVFDTSGDKFVPEVCGHCHGRTQDWKENDGDQGGRFVFFDAPAYEYAYWDPMWTKAAQEERLRELNRLVKMTHGNTGVYADYIDSLYRDGVETPGAVSSEPPVLPAWQNDAHTFQQWIRPNCRTCHMWQGTDFAEPFEAGNWIQDYVCDGVMPNAMQPMLNVWSRLDPLPADAINLAFGGEACFSTDSPPSLEILEPTNNTAVQLGGILGIRFRAQADDVEDGPDCCQITWTSDKEGILGFGPTLEKSLTRPGVHVITAIARDSRFRRTERTVTVRADNEPPVASIQFPEMDNDLLFRGIPYVVRGKATDFNQPLGLPCDALRWTSTESDLPFPFDACHQVVTFDDNGPRTLRMRAIDTQGAFDTAERVINVADPPLNAPPIVTILAPVDEGGIPGEEASQIRFSAVDPDENAVVNWEVSVKEAVRGEDAFEVIAAGECQPGAQCRPTIDWNPREAGFFNCGGNTLDIRVEATDPNGTGVDQIRVTAFFPPC